MKHISLSIIVLSCLYATSFSQNIPGILSPDNQEHKYHVCSRAHAFDKVTTEHVLSTTSDIDVLTYDLFMDWRLPFATVDTVMPTYRYSGKNTLAFIPTKALGTITMNGATMNIDSVRLDGIMLSTAAIQQPENGTWSIKLANPITLDTHLMEIWYTYIGDAKNGFYYYPKGMFVRKFQGLDSNFVEEDLAYVMSQPEDARHWMPCNDSPNDKARARITVRVPFDSTLSDKDNIRVTSNGDLVSIQIGSESGNSLYRDFSFYDTTLIPTYLMVVNASRFVDFTLWAKIPNSNDSIPIYNYVWKKDYDGKKTDGSEYNAQHALSYTPSMITGYIPLFGPYPFKTYGHTAAQPFWAGGMEHQRMSTINRTWLRGWSSNGLAHEVMHQWFGDLVTCETWGEIWLNEGAGTWGEALWYETWGGYPEYIAMMKTKRNDYIRINAGNLQPPIYGIPIENVFNYATSYAKASWVYHMLRTMLGDSVFYPVLRTYLKTYAYGNANTEQFKQMFKTLAPNPAVPYDTYFDQWLMKRGHPQLKFTVLREHRNEKNEPYVHFVVRQTQSGKDIPEIFQFPLTISFIGEKDTTHYNTVMNSLSHEGYIKLQSPLKKAIIDPRSDVLLEADSASGIYLSIDELQHASSMAKIRGFGDEVYLSIQSAEFSQALIHIYNLSGATVYSEQFWVNTGELREVELPKLPSGMYIVSIRTNNGVQLLKYIQ
ncbi:MAG: M1 family aminopeptidase [Ignavibacteria bacterium]